MVKLKQANKEKAVNEIAKHTQNNFRNKNSYMQIYVNSVQAVFLFSGSASVAKGLSLYLDTLLNDTFKNAFMDVAPIKVNYMAEYFDFFSFGIAILLSGKVYILITQ